MPENAFSIVPSENLGLRQLPPIPYDQNNRWPAVQWGMIVDGQALDGYLPVKMTNNGDGTCSPDVITTPGITAIVWGGPQAAVVGVASSIVVAANTSRKGLIFVNDSDAIIYLAMGVAAVVSNGIRLNPRGGSYEMTLQNLSTQQIRAIATAAGSVLTYQEAT